MPALLGYTAAGWLIILEAVFAIWCLIEGQYWDAAAYGAAAGFLGYFVLHEIERG